MIAKFYAFSKRRNSTRIPAADEGVDRDIVLKKPTSVINPTIQAQTVNDGVNYVYIPDFARYYFITDTIKLSNGLTEFRLSVDVLASMRSEILQKAAYVTRAYSQTDNMLTDTFYPSKIGTLQKINYADFVPVDIARGGYVLSAIGVDSSAMSADVGPCQYYILTAEEMADIIKFIFDQTNFEGDITEGVVKTFFNPSQYLVSCYFTPFLDVDSSGILDRRPLRFGWWQTADTYQTISGTGRHQADTAVLKIPRPNESDIDNYINYAPYAVYRIYIPYYGMFDLDSELLKGDSVIQIIHDVDVPTGTGKIKVCLGHDEHNDYSKILFTAEASVSAAVPLAQSSLPLDWNTAIAGTVKNVVGRFSTDEFDRALTDISSLYLDINRQVSVSGTAGCFSQPFFERRAFIICDYKEQAEKNHALFGDPLCRAVRLSDMTGFVKCLSFNMQSPNYLQTECDQVNQFLNGGAYIE